jgi:putative ABC transport system permease protein
MNILEIITQSIQSIKSNKLRTLLTMLGIVVGIFSIIVIMTIITMLQSTIDNGISFLSKNSFQTDIMRVNNTGIGRTLL